MKKAGIVFVMALGIMCLCSCGDKGKESNETKKVNNEVQNVSESGIDISELNDNDIDYIHGDVDMNVYNPDNQEIADKSDVIIKGKLVKMDSHLDVDSFAIKSDYTFEVEDTLKGETGDTFTINMLGGIMSASDYKKEAGEENVEADDSKKYIGYGLNGFKPLDLNSEYVIYAKYHQEKDNYYPVYYYYGIYKNNGAEMFERYGTSEEDRQNLTLDVIENNIELEKVK